MTNPINRVWLITGCSSGLGRELAGQVLARGERVMLTARRPESVDDLVARYPALSRSTRLDVTAAGDPAAAIEQTRAAFGRLDVLVNNAGYGLIGGVEETSPEEYRALFEANVFGLIETTRAALPLMREAGDGSTPRRIVLISSNLGMSSRPAYAYYSASKFAVEGFGEGLAAEVEPFGIAVTMVEPGAFRTQFLSGSIKLAATRLPAYEDITGKVREAAAGRSGKQPGDPVKGAAMILQAVDAEKPPLRLPLGTDALANIQRKLDRLTADFELWKQRSASTDFAAS